MKDLVKRAVSAGVRAERTVHFGRSLSPYIAALCIAFGGCASYQSYTAPAARDWHSSAPTEDAAQTRVYFVGETAGAAPDDKLLQALRSRLGKESKDAVLVLLGSSTRAGLPDSATTGRSDAEADLHNVLSLAKGFPGKTYVVPGEADWNYGRPGGLDGLNRMEAALDSSAGRNLFRPDDGFPGPDAIKLADGLRLILLDTAWWFAGDERPFGETGDYDLRERSDLLAELAELVEKYDDDTLILAGHHPLVSSSEHGGYFPLRTHLFPLTAAASDAYLPLPIVGSLLPLYAKLVGRSGDLASPDYAHLQQAILSILAPHERTIYVASHDRNLLFSKLETGKTELYHIVAGSPTGGPVAKGNGATFASAKPGFTVLSIGGDGSVSLEFVGAGSTGSESETLFRSEVLEESEPTAAPPPSAAALNIPADSTVTIAPNPDYAAGPVKRFFWGAHHRNAWDTEVSVDVIDISDVAGGLTPVKRGGGQQTVSLRLANPDKREYVLRSIDKRPENSIPAAFRKTIARDILRDQTSAQHPYSAFMIPPLATAAGVLHTEPRLVWVPDDPALGVFQTDFANKLMMLEIRPDDDMSGFDNFGNSKNVVSAATMYRKITADNDDVVDQRAFARARLFDMLLSDWDRHRDQWRWAAFESADGDVYRPVPRDRDWAFNKWDGLWPVLLSWYDPKFRGFGPNYGNLKGLSNNGYEQDRRLLNDLERTDWIEIADSIRMAVTDNDIQMAVNQMPEPVRSMDAETIASTLRTRLARLPRVAEKYYELQARIVDVVGSNKHEEFVVTRSSNGDTRVTVFKTKKEGRRLRQVYDRQFVHGETKEVRLYGLGGNDRFKLDGSGKNGIRVVIVGGTGEDHLADHSHVSGIRRHTVFFDTQEGNIIEASGETRVRTSRNPLVNQYDQRGSYSHNVRLPAIFFGFNRDDGVFLGGGVTSIRHGFRKKPYAARQRLVANYSGKTSAYNAVYAGDFPSLFGNWDMTANAHAFAPRSVQNYYGLGNETTNAVGDRDFYRAQIQRYGGELLFGRTSRSGMGLSVGPVAELVRVTEDSTRIVAIPQPGLAPTTYDSQFFVGGRASLSLKTLDSALNPRRGVRWVSDAVYRAGVSEGAANYLRLGSDLAFFISPSEAPQATLGFRAGGSHIVGEFPFFDASSIGASNNLRGYRNKRFAGRSAAWANAEARIKLFNVSTYLAVGDLGVLGFVDTGRVWTDAESSGVWHSGYGGGLWFNFADALVFQATVGFSDEGRNELIGFGFQF